MKEKFTNRGITSCVMVQENRIVSFDRKNSIEYSFRVLENGFLGICYCQGEMSDEKGFAEAEKNLRLKRPYKFGLETGVRHRDKTETVLSDKELMELANEALEHINSKHPDFILNGSFSVSRTEICQQNEKGLDYSNKDCTIDAGFSFKHKDSKDITDGYFNLGMRTYDLNKLYNMADNYLGNYGVTAELPDEIIIQDQYYGLLGKLGSCLDAEYMSLGTSLLSGKTGEKVFSDKFTLLNDKSDEECWHVPFFDGEGVTMENDKCVYIKNGVVLRGYADKKTADKYGVPHTGSAWRSYSDIPQNGNVNLRIERSEKTVKQLLDGRLSVVPVRCSGGGFNEKGEYAMPVQFAYLCDGEKFLGRLPEFTLAGNMFDMFGKDFIGVGSDNPVFNDKQILVGMKAHINRD